MTAVRVPVKQGSEAWLAARRGLITSTGIVAIMGLSPWSCEADLADEMMGVAERQEPNMRMRVGTALQPLIGQEYERKTGRELWTVDDLWVGEPEWAAASPDFSVKTEQRLVEAKWTASKSRFADGVPQDVEAQVAWALGVSGYPVADIAVLTSDELLIFEQEADPAMFADLVAIAEDFRRRLAVGGPFARDTARIKRDHPADDGTDMDADAELDEAVRVLLDIRSRKAALEKDETALEDAIKARMGDHARLIGDGFNVTWKKTKDALITDWHLVASGLLRQLPEPEQEALVGLHSTVRPGARPFRVTVAKEVQE